MWIRPSRSLLARMPSMRPPPAASSRHDPKSRTAAPLPPGARPPPEPPDADAETESGGFHESSYELRTGMDVVETEWPEDTTIPGALDDGP